MYELGIEENSHIKVPDDVVPAALFPLTVGTLVDAAALLNDRRDVGKNDLDGDILEELGFAASFFDAYFEAKFDTALSHEMTLLGSASYFLGQRPGSSLVLARKLKIDESDNAVEKMLIWVLQANWNQPLTLASHPIRGQLHEVASHLMKHFNDGASVANFDSLLKELLRVTYRDGTSRDLVLVEVMSAVIKLRIASSAWILLPRFTNLDDVWASTITQQKFPKELWPSQKLIGQAGIFAGKSGVIQMPTSAGKTRSVEIILRSAFLSNRTRVAVLVTPFRALCQEVATSLRLSFKGEDVNINELSDVLQLDFKDTLAKLFGQEPPPTNHILVLTPEKFLYALRQDSNLLRHIGVVVYDEGHQFDSGPRGIIYELLLTDIKSLLKTGAQTVLISAVIKNAEAIGNWLIGTEPNVVDGTTLLPTARAIAFASWVENRGQLLFFESPSYEEYDYFVPLSIERQKLKLRERERPRYFPERGDVKDIALYLGIRLSRNGTVAIFCGRKDTASGIAQRAVEVYERGFNLPSPSETADTNEIKRLHYLISKHFGEDSETTRAADKGIFVHHGTTPQGLRLSIEHAMRKELIKLVVCTSTLAQGVNLPIRYLIVASVMQGQMPIKTRDFQNLIGRAGRAGMYTEGLVIFADQQIYDKRQEQRWRFDSAIKILRPQNSEETTSSLLELLAPLHNRIGEVVPLEIYFWSEDQLKHWAHGISPSDPKPQKDLVKEITRRQRLLVALESYLMANRDTDSFEAYKTRIQTLATSTLAYALAEETKKQSLVQLFQLVATHIEEITPEPERQAEFSKTLLGISDAVRVESWVRKNAASLRNCSSGIEWLYAVWSLFQAVSSVGKTLLTKMQPDGLALCLVKKWIKGATYRELIDMAKQQNGTKPWGDGDKRHSLNETDILEFLERCIGFECPLILAAVGQFLYGETEGLANPNAKALYLFQKSLKYGLHGQLAISAYESGFADRSVAQDIESALQREGYQYAFFDSALVNHDYKKMVADVLEAYPTYFRTVLDSL